MEVRSRSASKENLQPFCAKLSCSALDCSDATKEFGAHPSGAHAGSGSGLSSPASDASRISIDDLTPHLRCGLCREHVAGAHVLSCSHIFCGCCLADHLIASPACPACQMALRSIPVRCVAIDHVVAALLPALAPAQRDAFKRRKERGESAPSIIAKMLWWLEAGAPTPGGAGDPAAAARGAPGNGMLLQHPQAGAVAGRGPSSSGAMHHQHHHHHHHQQQHMAAAGLAGALAAGAGVGGVPVGASAAHEAAMAAAMTAAAAAAAASSAAAVPAFNLSSQLGGMSLGGLGGMGGVPGLAAAHNAAAFAGLGGLRDPHTGMQLADPAVAAYQAALQSAVAMQSAHGHVMGGGYLMGM